MQQSAAVVPYIVYCYKCGHPFLGYDKGRTINKGQGLRILRTFSKQKYSMDQ